MPRPLAMRGLAGAGTEVMTWRELMPELVQAIARTTAAPS